MVFLQNFLQLEDIRDYNGSNSGFLIILSKLINQDQKVGHVRAAVGPLFVLFASLTLS